MDAAAYNKIVDAYADRLFRFAVKNMKDEDRANDVVQESFVRLWINRDEVNPEKVRSWLFTTAYRQMLDAWRNEKRFSGEEVSEVSMQYEQEQPGLRDVLDQALARLPEIQRTAVLLRDYEGYSYEEIGEICKLSESQVKVYIFRARKAMKKFIGRMDLVV